MLWQCPENLSAKLLKAGSVTDRKLGQGYRHKSDIILEEQLDCVIRLKWKRLIKKYLAMVQWLTSINLSYSGSRD
jgi:hypothetical protein